MEPVLLAANQPPQFYLGGAQIAQFRDGTHGQGTSASASNRSPEDWVASTVTRFGIPADAEDGLTRLPDGRLLREAIIDEPEVFLAPEHLAELGANPGLLVKLLDAGERLPVHCHPDRSFAQTHLGCSFGKTEAWIVVATLGVEPHVYLGFDHDVEPAELETWFVTQDSGQILGAMNRLPVQTGDAIFVPAGTPHAISAGLFIVELQEPTDFSVMLEWKEFGMPDLRNEQLGISRELSLQCFDRNGMTANDIEKYHRKARANTGGVATLFPADADPFFQAQDVVVTPAAPTSFESSYWVLIVVEGAGSVTTTASVLPVKRGSTVLVPYSAGPVELRGAMRAMRCLPPKLEHAT
jgi:mannose-6-phosphate isomerase